MLSGRLSCGGEGPDGAPDEERPRDGAADAETRPPGACVAGRARADAAVRREGRELAKDAGALKPGGEGEGDDAEPDGRSGGDRARESRAAGAHCGAMTTGCRRGGALRPAAPPHDTTAGTPASRVRMSVDTPMCVQGTVGRVATDTTT